VELYFAQLISGISAGSIYAILVTGLNLLILVGGVFQYSYPSIVVMNMYVIWLGWGATGGNLPLTICIAIISGIAINVLTEPIFRRLGQQRAMVASFIAAIGIATILSDIMGRQINQGMVISFPTALLAKGTIVGTGLVTITTGQLVIIMGAVVSMALIFYLLYRTRIGREFRAIAEDSLVARILGIKAVRMSMLSYAITGLLGALSAVFLTMYIGMANESLATTFSLKVFIVAMFAGIGNLGGGLIAALILGLLEAYMVNIVPGEWATAVFYGLVLIVVMVRPRGLFGAKI